MADQNITALPTATAPESSDQLLLIGATEEKLIDYDKLADAILGKIASKNFTLDQGNKTLLAALNELNSKAKRIENVSFVRAYNHNTNKFSINKELPSSSSMMIIFGGTIESGQIFNDGRVTGFSHYTVTYQDGIFDIEGQMEWYTMIPVLFGW